MDDNVASDFIGSLRHMPGISIEYAVEALGGSEKVYEKMVLKVVRFLPSNIERLDEGIAADDGLLSFSVVAHGVKSLLNQIGCRRLARRAEALELEAKNGNIQFCVENYAIFKKELIIFYKTVSDAAAKYAGDSPGSSCTICYGNLRDFYETILGAKKAAEDYDAIGASEILTPLEKYRFGAKEDTLVSSAVEALDSFKYVKALEYIGELLNKCEESLKPPEKEEPK